MVTSIDACWILLDLCALGRGASTNSNINEILAEIEAASSTAEAAATASANVLRYCVQLCRENNGNVLAVYLIGNEKAMELLLEGLKLSRPGDGSRLHHVLPGQLWTAAKHCPLHKFYTDEQKDDKKDGLIHASYHDKNESNWRLTQRTLRTLQCITDLLKKTSRENFVRENTGDFFKALLWLTSAEARQHLSQVQKLRRDALIVFWAEVVCQQKKNGGRYTKHPEIWSEFLEAVHSQLLSRTGSMTNEETSKAAKLLRNLEEVLPCTRLNRFPLPPPKREEKKKPSAELPISPHLTQQWPQLRLKRVSNDVLLPQNDGRIPNEVDMAKERNGVSSADANRLPAGSDASSWTPCQPAYHTAYQPQSALRAPQCTQVSVSHNSSSQCFQQFGPEFPTLAGVGISWDTERALPPESKSGAYTADAMLTSDIAQIYPDDADYEFSSGQKESVWERCWKKVKSSLLSYF